MQKHLRWKGLYYNSIENCIVNFTESEIAINSSIIGKYDSINYQADYLIKTTVNWKVISVEIIYCLNKIKHTISASHQNDSWTVNSQARTEFKHCVDIDITLTPFTNTLPISRLNLEPNKPQQIEVLYVDVLNNDIRVARQQYTKKSPTEYNFQNVPNDFETDIIVDKEGFVVRYPELFEQIDV